MIYRVQLNRLVREKKIISIEAQNRSDLEEKLHAAFDEDDDQDWKPDPSWGTEEANHYILAAEVERKVG